MTTPTTQVSFSSVLKRAGKSVETVLSVVDIVDDGLAIATNYVSRVKQEQLKEQEQQAVEFDNQLLIRKAASANEFKAAAFQVGSKARQLQALPEYEENIQAFNELLK